MMRNRAKRLGRLAGTAVVGLALVACGDGLGPAGTAEMSVSLQESGGSASGIMASVSSAEWSSSEISSSAVASVELTLDRVEALPTGQVETSEGAWVSLQVEDEATVDLMDLASSGPITVARGTVVAGNYTNVRLFFSAASITTDEEITLEGGGTVPPGTYDLSIPSGVQTGVKIPLGAFVITEGESATVTLEIDTEGSVQTVVYNEPEGFIMNSVLIQVGARP